MLQSFMRRVRLENVYRKIIPGIRVKLILLELCAARVIYPFSITDCNILSRGGESRNGRQSSDGDFLHR